jgi:ribonuclease P protein component
VRWLSFDAAQPPEIGYAIGRHVGPAVTRNRVRRRLRAVVAGRATDMRPGRALLGANADAARLPFSELTEAVRTCLAAAGALATSDPG